MNKYEKFEIKTIKRNEIHNADYNPRKIDDKARNRLKKFLKTVGLLQPACIVNKQTMNCISGHQRLSLLDSFFKKPDYELCICLVDLTEKEEIEANVKLNNQNLQGEWDKDKLFGLKDIIPDLDFNIDLDFDKFDLDYMFSADEKYIEKMNTEMIEIKKDIDDIEKLKETKRNYRHEVDKANKNGENYQN